MTRARALAGIFGADARVTTRTAYLAPSQVEAVRQAARAPFDARRVTSYQATIGDSVAGTAYVDQAVVRTMPQTLLIALDCDGAVLAVEVLAWAEPDDYRPPARWLARSRGASDPAEVRAGERLPHLAGATLTARAVAAAVRRALALHRVLAGGGP